MERASDLRGLTWSLYLLLDQLLDFTGPVK